MAAHPTCAEILALELALQDPAVRASRDAAAALLADHFFEIGSSGFLEDKDAILGRLAAETRAGGFTPPRVLDATLRPLAPGVVALTYRTVRMLADGTERHVLRTSVWLEEAGRWRMGFHQGTVSPAP